MSKWTSTLKRKFNKEHSDCAKKFAGKYRRTFYHCTSRNGCRVRWDGTKMVSAYIKSDSLYIEKWWTDWETHERRRFEGLFKVAEVTKSYRNPTRHENKMRQRNPIELSLWGWIQIAPWDKYFITKVWLQNTLCRETQRRSKLSILQYIPRNMHTVFALLCFAVVIHWLIFPYPSGLLHWHCGNLTIAPVPAKQPWWIWINTCEFIMNDCITTTKQSTTKPCEYFLGYTAHATLSWPSKLKKWWACLLLTIVHQLCGLMLQKIAMLSRVSPLVYKAWKWHRTPYLVHIPSPSPLAC